MLKRKVYIIDFELVSPIALGASKIMESIRANTSADRLVPANIPGNSPFKNGAFVDVLPDDLLAAEHDRIKHTIQKNRKLELLAACYALGKERFELLASLMEPTKTGVVLGVGADYVSFEDFEKELIGYSQQNEDPLKELLSDPELIGSRANLINNPLDLYSIYLAARFNAAAFQKTVLTACVSSTQAIAFGYDAVAKGQVEACIVGGTDALINQMALVSFGKIGIVSETSSNNTCKPFDVNRNGTLVGEAAGIAILVSEDFLQKHQLNPIAELMGFGNTLDGYKITAPDPEGNHITRAIRDAVSNAGIKARDIDYINAHGTGTKHNDELELNCIKRALGESALSIPVSSTKDRHGHAIAAAGIQEFCILLELMRQSTIPANLNLENPCSDAFDLVRENRIAPINYALTNNLAFGGVNTVLALKNESI